ncbi:hypothetical protein V8E54_004070 [Elaphomyces granulatus]
MDQPMASTASSTEPGSAILAKIQAQFPQFLKAQQTHYSTQQAQQQAQLEGIPDRLDRLETPNAPNNTSTSPPQRPTQQPPFPRPIPGVDVVAPNGAMLWKPTDIGLFYPDIPHFWDTPEVVVIEETVYYRTVYAFTNKLRWNNELDKITRAGFIFAATIDDWHTELEKRFRLAPNQANTLLAYTHYITSDIVNNMDKKNSSEVTYTCYHDGNGYVDDYSNDFTYDYSYTEDELPEDDDSSDESGYMDDYSDNYFDDDYSYTDDELPEDNDSSDDHVDNTEPISAPVFIERQHIIDNQRITSALYVQRQLDNKLQMTIDAANCPSPTTDDPKDVHQIPHPRATHFTQWTVILPFSIRVHISYQTKVYFANPCVVSLGIQADGLNLTTPKEKLRATADLEFPQQLETYFASTGRPIHQYIPREPPDWGFT